MIVLRLSIEEANVLEKILPEVQALPAEDTVHLLEIMKQLDIVKQEYHYEIGQANKD